MGDLSWAGLLALLTSVGFGALSAVFPFANAEAYVMLSQVSTEAGAIPVAVGVGIGQTIGKLTLFLGVRQGRRSHVASRHRDRVRTQLEEQRVSPTRERFRALMQQLLVLVGSKRWGLPIVALAAVVGLPPLYAVALLAGATRMRVLWFALVVLGGRLVRFLLVATGVSGFHDW